MRLSRYLAVCGVASRRQSEEIIRAGKVVVDGQVETDPARQVEEGRHQVRMGKRRLVRPSRRLIVMLNKPRGVVVTVRDPHQKNTVMRLVSRYKGRLFPVGRIDRNSEGLLLLTNDGDLALRLTHPRYHLEKEYRVAVKGEPTASDLEKLRRGLRLEDDRDVTQPADVRVLRRRRGRSHRLPGSRIETGSHWPLASERSGVRGESLIDREGDRNSKKSGGV